jgi:hypothetical protein
MSTNRDFHRIAEAWLAEGPSELADRVLDAALDEVHLTHQRRVLRVPWRNPPMSMPLRLAAGIAIIAVLGVGAIRLFGSGPNIGAGPTPSPSPSPTPIPTASARPSATSLDPATFTTYTSARYGFSIGHPTSWSEKPATRAWSFDIDSDATAPSSAGADHFSSEGGQVRVSAWTVPLEAGTPIDSRGAILAWITDYCARTGTAGCDGLVDRATPFCNERRDCHAAVLVSFDDWVGLFASGGNYTGNVLIVAVWRAEDAPEVAPYGGAQQLLTTFLGTMNIVPATGSDQLEGWPPPSPG